MDILFNRRSIRKYTDQPVEKEKIEMILRAGMAAPSAHNKQPWEFIVIDDKKMLADISEMLKYGKMIAKAPLCFLMCIDKNIQDKDAYAVQDGSVAAQNMLLAMYELGLGGVWVNIEDNPSYRDQIRKIHNLPENIYPICYLPCGYRDERRRPTDRYIEEKIHHNKF